MIGIGILLLLIQFIRPEKNEGDDRTFDISREYQIPTEVNTTLKVACNDCHSNKTTYPWYSKVQPVAWYLEGHVEDGKRHLNFSSFTKLPLSVQNHKFEEIIEMVEEKEMPLADYTYFGLHEEAQLEPKERKEIVDWAKNQMTYLKATYPADSLKMKPRAK